MGNLYTRTLYIRSDGPNQTEVIFKMKICSQKLDYQLGNYPGESGTQTSRGNLSCRGALCQHLVYKTIIIFVYILLTWCMFLINN